MPSAKILTDTNSSSLETSLNTFLSTITTLVSTEFSTMFKQFSSGTAIIEYSVLVIYT